jgi:hypothetical protein
MALPNAANGWVARHLSDVIDAKRKHPNASAPARSRSGGFAPSVARPNY